MRTLWITYAWVDNEEKDIDYIISQLDQTSIEPVFDSRSLVPGQRLWEQIGGIITDPERCNAWAIVLTPDSVSNEKCLEELAYALDRALSGNPQDFPVFALLHKIRAEDMPVALKVRLGICLSDPNWVDQVVAAVQRRPAGFIPGQVSELVVTTHETADGLCLEIRPRLRHIVPVCVAVEVAEREICGVRSVVPGPPGEPPTTSATFGYKSGQTTLSDGTEVWFAQANNEASPTSSYYIHCQSLPSRIWFGRPDNLHMLHSGSARNH